MGYNVELRSLPGENATLGELERRARLAGLIPHPEYGEGEFLFDCGILSLNPPEKIKLGSWAWVRMSWSADEEELGSLIELADKIGARVYDTSIGDYITRQNFDEALAKLREGYRWATEVLGVVTSADEIDERHSLGPGRQADKNKSNLIRQQPWLPDVN